LIANSSSRKALVAISLLWFGSLAGAGLAFLTQVVLARELTPVGYGVFAAALATVTLLVPLAGFGVQGFWLKAFGEEGWGAVRWLTPSFRYAILSTAVALLLLAGWAAWGPHEASFRWLLCWLLPVVTGHLFIELVSGKLQLEERYNALALWQLLPHLTRLSLVLVVVFNATVYPVLNTIAAAYTLVSLAMMLIGFSQLHAMAQGRFNLKGHPKPGVGESMALATAPPLVRVSDIANQAWPFGLSSMFYLLYFQSAVILLRYLAGDEAAGVFNVALTVMMGVYSLPSVLYQKFILPKLHRWAFFDPSRMRQTYRLGGFVMLALGIVTMFMMWLLAGPLLPLLFGEAYRDSLLLVMILAVAVPFRFLALSSDAMLTTRDFIRIKVRLMGIAAFFHITLNLFLIPKFGAVGAALAIVATEALLSIAFVVKYYRMNHYGVV